MIIIAWVLQIAYLLTSRFFAFPEFFIFPYLANFGFKPYLEIIDQHFPGSIFWPLNLYQLGVNTPEKLKIILLILVAAQAWLIFKFAKNSWAVWAYAGWQTFLAGNKLWFDTFLALPILLAFIAFNFQNWFAVGLFLGLGVVFKQTVILLCFILGVWLLIQKKFKFLGHFVLGVSLPLLGMIIYLIKLQVLPTWWQWTIKFNLISYHNFSGFNIDRWAMLSLLLTLFSVLVFWFRKQQFLCVWILALFVGSLSRFDTVHLHAVVPLLALGWGQIISKNSIIKIAICLIIITLIIRDYGRDYPFWGEPLKLQTKLINSYVTSGQETFLLGLQPNLYVTTQTLPAGRFFVWQLPWYYQSLQNRQIQALESSKPKYIFYSSDAGIDDQSITSYASAVLEYVHQNYRLLKQAEGIEVYVRHD